MTGKEQSRAWFRQFLRVKMVAPWVASDVEAKAKEILQGLGGIASAWRVDYPTTCYSAPQLINGMMVDLSTPESVARFYEARGV
jgi:hypothetical protein